MSKAVKQSVYILIVLLIAALGFGAYTFLGLQETKEEKLQVEREFSDARDQHAVKEKQNAEKVKEFKKKISTISSEKDTLMKEIEKIERETKEEIDSLASQIADITDSRDKWKRRIETIQEERDQLLVKIDNLTNELEEKSRIAYTEEKPKEPARIEPESINVASIPTVSPDGTVVDEQYWVDLLQAKASLEIKIDDLNEELSAKSIEVVEIKQKNQDLELQISSLQSEKETIEAEVQHTSKMIDNISLELARTKNDKKYISNRAEKLTEENEGLRHEMKKLLSVKNALEKSIVRITQEKDKVESQLGKTETLIQSKIDEIWDIKDELDHSIRSSKTNGSPSEVELPPIVVSSSGESVSFNSGESAPGFNGSVISINEPNNFVIVDIGQNSGIRLGDHLSVYRDSKYIARLEVIQVREDISAADLKDQWSKIQVGDVIR